MGVSLAQVARNLKRGYEAIAIRTLRRYINALGDPLGLEVAVTHKVGNPIHSSRTITER
jgi:hypothetical protein